MTATAPSDPAQANPYETDLDRNAANYVPLSPLSFLARTAATFPDRLAVAHGKRRYTWAQTAERCRRLASALAARGVGRNDTVAAMLTNTPEGVEAAHGVPMAGGVLNMLNTRLDAATIAFILDHGEAKVLLTDTEFAPVIREALTLTDRELLVVDVDDSEGPGGEKLGETDYESFLTTGDPAFEGLRPSDEWDAIALNYTSGTTGDPKGVVYHHRGAYLNALGNIMVWGMKMHPVYLWTLPMFHCNGWCFPWTITVQAGTHVCLRKVEAAAIYKAFAEEGVTHLCGAPIVMSMLLNADEQTKQSFPQSVQMMTAASPPPAPVLAGMQNLGIDVTHVYGLTEVYGPAVVCAWHDEWSIKPVDEQAALKSRQGVRYPSLEGLYIADAETLDPVPADGETMGEVMMRGNVVMKGYLKNPSATDKAFQGGWFRTGDLGVMHEDGYIELKDRSKDVIISGGENISTIEVEGVLYRHPAVMDVAVVARPDEKWGETPCAFVTLRPGKEATEAQLIAFARENMAHFKAPKTVVFGELPKTSTGKVQKFVLRERARNL
ncbi:acyl-CoA synthetase [Thalassobaculum salexigens]|uniref:acyl-CoA synthetase n=1 Tax=Thalassobaculum salexigens TaxID=455360 RepID=UPI00040DB132|nr:acyl-CoA synthetase [Thalassobaculum salexigens]